MHGVSPPESATERFYTWLAEWSKAVDCKSTGEIPRRFESGTMFQTQVAITARECDAIFGGTGHWRAPVAVTHPSLTVAVRLCLPPPYYGPVAQLVEHGIENPGVGSSNLPRSTSYTHDWQSGNAADCKSAGETHRRFKSGIVLQLKWVRIGERSGLQNRGL